MKAKTYAKLYSLLDPIIKRDPKISFQELGKKHPEVANQITYWSFNARKNALFPKRGSKKTAVRKVAKKAVKKISVKKSNQVVVAAIKKIIPNTKKFKEEYVVIGKTLLKKPNTTHSSMKNAKMITMCDAYFYQFRRKFCDLMGLELTAPVVDSSHRKRKSPASPAVFTSRKKPQLYTVLYQTESNGFNEAAKSLLSDFIESVNRERAMGTLEMVETISPQKALEVRSYK